MVDNYLPHCRYYEFIVRYLAQDAPVLNEELGVGEEMQPDTDSDRPDRTVAATGVLPAAAAAAAAAPVESSTRTARRVVCLFVEISDAIGSARADGQPTGERAENGKKTRPQRSSSSSRRRRRQRNDDDGDREQ